MNIGPRPSPRLGPRPSQPEAELQTQQLGFWLYLRASGAPWKGHACPHPVLLLPHRCPSPTCHGGRAGPGCLPILLEILVGAVETGCRKGTESRGRCGVSGAGGPHREGPQEVRWDPGWPSRTERDKGGSEVAEEGAMGLELPGQSPVLVLLHTRGGRTLLSYPPLRLSVLICGTKGSVRGGSKLASCLSLDCQASGPF